MRLIKFISSLTFISIKSIYSSSLPFIWAMIFLFYIYFMELYLLIRFNSFINTTAAWSFPLVREASGKSGPPLVTSIFPGKGYMYLLVSQPEGHSQGYWVRALTGLLGRGARRAGILVAHTRDVIAGYGGAHRVTG